MNWVSRVCGLLGITLVTVGAPLYAETPLRLNTATPPITPFDQYTPPGVYGHMMTAGRPVMPARQPVRILAGGGSATTVYSSTQPAGLTVGAEDVFAVEVGRVYRLKLSEPHGLPGVAVYPTIELVDRLHPPEGKAAEFPVVIEITQDEIEAAVNDRLVTKVIYVRPRDVTGGGSTATTVLPTTRIPSTDNVVKAASDLGRPIAIVRLGGRTPESSTDSQFFVGGSLEYPVDR